MKLKLDTSQMAGVQCECGAWDLLEDIAICVFLAGDHGFEQKWVLNSLAISSPERWICESAALNMPANLENSLVSTGLKRSVFIPVPKKGNAKESSNYHTTALISHASKVMLKILQPGFSNTWTMNSLMLKLVLEKAEEPEIKLPTSAGSWKKQESSRKTSTSALLTMPKPLTVWITINCGKFWKRWEYQTT